MCAFSVCAGELNPPSSLCFSMYPQQQLGQQGNPNSYGGMMMNGSMPVNGGNGAHMGQMQGQMGMNPLAMGRMPMGSEQVGPSVCLSKSVHLCLSEPVFVRVCVFF